MNYTWHEPKRQANLKKHGLDLADAFQVFDGPVMTRENPRDYEGEQRFNSTGFLGAALVTLSHTENSRAIHIIPMRKASTHESREFYSYL
ncbi:MAG: BrnT family toxin [Candidatus Accumulibacter sp.]|nr:BrnT family toxin [Accumulibacter sp.]